MAVSWKVYVDWDRDGITSSDDITADVHSAKWSLGFADDFERVAGASKLELELLNADGKYSPENSGGTYFGKFGPHTRVRVESISSLGTIQHYNGWLESVNPDSNIETPYSRLMATDAKPFLESRSLTYNLYQDVTADVVIRDILTDLREWPPAQEPTFVLGQSILGTDLLVDEADGFALDTGNSMFTYAGDTWNEDTSPMRAIADLVKGENGRFFYDRAGSATFWSRDHFATSRTNTGTLTYTDWIDIDYQYGKDIINDVRMSIQPRTLTLDQTLIYEFPESGAFKLNNQAEKTLRLRYELQDSEDDIATIPEDCRIEVAWTPNSTLVNYDVEFYARHAVLTIRNVARFEFVTVNSIKVYGPNISRKNKLEVKAIDNDSIRLYGLRQLIIDADLFEDEAAAQNIVDTELRRRSEPRGMVKTIYLQTKQDESNLSQMLNWPIGTRFAISDTPTYHDGSYLIIGESHQLTNGLKLHTAQYNLMRAGDEDYFLLGTSLLDGDDILFA